MKFITKYKEFGFEVNESVVDYISDKPIPNSHVILEYLKNGKDDGVRCSGIYDYIKNEPQFDTIHLFTDGEYFWDSEEIFHFEKYNIALNNDFIKKIFSLHNVEFE